VGFLAEIFMKKKRYLIIQKGRLGWYWRVQTGCPPKTGDKIAGGLQPYNNKKFCLKMAFSVVKMTMYKTVKDTKGLIVYLIQL